jgi:uncharacterized damage-inducible protein DinB
VGHAGRVSLPFPEPTRPADSRAEVFVGYLDYFRSRIVAKVEELPEAELRRSRVPSGWTPLQLVKHLTFVELRWLEWGFEGRQVANPWGDQEADRWHVPEEETRDELLATLRARGERSRAIIAGHDLATIGQPSPRWNGADPPTLERVVLHVMQEYARHLGHLDVAVELVDGTVGE